MTRGGFVALVAFALAAGLALRLARLDVRPMHHDEANQALKTGDLLETGQYRYDTHDHHGPTLYYLALLPARVRGQSSLASLDERTLRLVPVCFGGLTILLVAAVGARIDRTAGATAAWLAALSPALTYYSRMFIQESLFAGAAVGFVLALGTMATRGTRRAALAAGLCAGFAIATKETSAIVLPAALLACAVALAWAGRRWPATWRRDAAIASGTTVVVAALFYSSWLSNPGGVLDPFRAAGTYLDRGLAPVAHVQPPLYYFRLLAGSVAGGLVWSEALILVLAVAGLGAALSNPLRSDRADDGHFWLRFIGLFAVATAFVYSAIRYKTPWNVVPMHVGFVMLGGAGFAAAFRLIGPRPLRWLSVIALVAALSNLGVQSWRAAIRYGADPRNPYAYAHTVTDFLRLAARVTDLAATSPAGSAMAVTVVAAPHEQWPLPWYLRRLSATGYWTTATGAALDAPVVIASQDQSPAVDAALGDRYVSEFYGLRPDVLLVLYVERGLWDSYLQRISRTGAGRADAHTPVLAQSTVASAASLWQCGAR